MIDLLINAIQAEALTGTPTEIVTAFDTVVVVRVDRTRRDWVYVSATLLDAGLTGEQVDNFYDGLATIPGGRSLRAAMLSSGADFSLDAIQAGIESARGQLGAITDVLLALGKPRAKRHVKCGLPSLPSEPDVTEALQRIATRQQWAAAVNDTVSPMLDAGATFPEIVGKLQELL